MKKVLINEIEYELLEDNKDCFDKTVVGEKITDYFDSYDYILGDYAYGKLRLKGFCEKENKIFNEINDINNKENYLKKECAYACKYFLLKKTK